MIVRYAIVIMLMGILPNAHCEHLRGPDKEEMKVDRPIQEKWNPAQTLEHQHERRLQYDPYYNDDPYIYGDYEYQRGKRRLYDKYDRQYYGDDYAYQRDRRRRYDNYNRQNGDGGYIQEKWTPAQKRQYQRDRRRRYTNPNRTQAEEDAERIRKHEQGIFDRRRDPYNRQYGDHEYAAYREERLREDCSRNRVSCNYHALGWDAGDRRYDYDPIHGEHYRGTRYDHDTSNLFNY